MVIIENIDAISNTLDAFCSLSNCPPYSIWYPAGNDIFSLICLRISFTTPLRSRPDTLAETTLFRHTFSRLIVFGPDEDTLLAIFPSGTLVPSLSIVRFLIFSAVVLLDLFAFKVSL